jgi:hypothetical protein
MATIRVAQDHIDAGKRHDPYSCALAQAISDYLTDDAMVYVDCEVIEFESVDEQGVTTSLFAYETPIDCQRFIHEHDRGVAKPFTTRLPIPRSLLK